MPSELDERRQSENTTEILKLLCGAFPSVREAAVYDGFRTFVVDRSTAQQYNLWVHVEISSMQDWEPENFRSLFEHYGLVSRLRKSDRNVAFTIGNDPAKGSLAVLGRSSREPSYTFD